MLMNFKMCGPLKIPTPQGVLNYLAGPIETQKMIAGRNVGSCQILKVYRIDGRSL